MELLHALNQLLREAGREHIKCHHVIQRALENAGRLNQVLVLNLDNDAEDLKPESSRLYSILSGLVHSAEASKVIVGQGNFGSPSRGFPAAHPRYTEIGITESGLRILAEQQSAKNQQDANRQNG